MAHRRGSKVSATRWASFTAMSSGRWLFERSDDDFGRMAGIRIEDDHLAGGMDARVGASCGLDSDGLAGEASYSFFNFLLHRSCVLLELEPAVPGPVILDDECVPQMYCLRTTRFVSFPYSTSSKRAIGDASPLRGPILMMRV